MELSIKRSVNPQEWDECVKCSEFGTIYQTETYARYLEGFGRKPLFVKMVSGKQVLAMSLVFLSPQFFSTRLYNSFTSPLFEVLSRVKPFYWSFYGPIVFSKNIRAREVFLKNLRSSLIKNGKAQLISPPLCDESAPFLAQDFNVKPLMTCIIDLRLDFEELKRKMDKKSALKNAERAMRRGVQVCEITKPEGFEAYYTLLKESRQRLGIKPYAKSEVLPFLDMIKKGYMKCFMAMKDEKPLSGIMISTFNGYLNEWGAAQSFEDISGKFYGNDLLRYHIIEWGHNSGCKFYDQSGLQLSSTKDLGIYNYKTKWGGLIKTYHSYGIK